MQNKLGKGAGETYFPLWESDVNLWNVWNTLKEVVGCRALQFSECVQQTGLSRAELVTALGRGIGATGAHALGHQGGFNFTPDVKGCLDCYDSVSAVSRVYLFGALHWSDRAREVMRRVLPPG